MALAKELVELHHGEISVHNEMGQGSKFIVRLPLGKQHLKEQELIDETITVAAENGSQIQIDGYGQQAQDKKKIIDTVSIPSKSESKTEKHQPVILIVEDNQDVRTYVREHLDTDYQVKEACDGADGFEKATDIIPDLIISDVMMPGMNGFELCSKLKTDERTSHIPVILLTARASGESKLEGLETGADAYLIKPFDAKELQVRIKNLIEQRRELRERFSREITLQPQDIAITSTDERFLQRALNLIEKHLDNPDFDLATFTKNIGMSRTHLHRKLHALTNQSPTEFVRTIRLKRAASLLKQNYGNVAEITYKVGFNNPAYFAECFRKQFGQLPSEYK